MMGFRLEQARFQTAGLIQAVQDGRIRAPLELEPQNAFRTQAGCPGGRDSLAILFATGTCFGQEQRFLLLGNNQGTDWGNEGS
jgi:hypothetical protein